MGQSSQPDRFDVKDASGKVVHWTAETASPEALKLIGWNKSSLQPGDVITVDMYTAKTGLPAGCLNKVVLADGTVLHDTQLGGDSGNKSGYGPDAGGGIPGGSGNDRSNAIVAEVSVAVGEKWGRAGKLSRAPFAVFAMLGFRGPRVSQGGQFKCAIRSSK